MEDPAGPPPIIPTSKSARLHDSFPLFCRLQTRMSTGAACEIERTYPATATWACCSGGPEVKRVSKA